MKMDNTEKTCLVCHEAIEIFAIGRCDHPICFKCSTRMRGLCEQFYCPICRTDLPEVFFLTKREIFSEMPIRKFIKNRKLKIQFENENVRQRFEELLEHRCKLCPDRYPEKSFRALQDHMRRQHTLFFCDLCSALKIFSSERKFYTRQDLATHRRMGDKDDTSYKGHPLCQFCDERYLDKDELYKHLRKDHYFCHFCESLGSQDFFQDYSNLREHFFTDHYLCEEGDCLHKQFENAFRSEIDLKAHRASAHSRAQSKFQARQERTLNIDINLVPRPTSRARGAGAREDFEELRSEGSRRNYGNRKHITSKKEKNDMDRAIQASLSTMTEEAMKKDRKPQDKRPDTIENSYVNDMESFPSLGETTTTTTTSVTSTESGSLANKFALSHNLSVQHSALGSVEDFPTLTKSASGSDLGNTPQSAVNYRALKTSQPKMLTQSKGAKPQNKSQPQKQTKVDKSSGAFTDETEDFPELPKAERVRHKGSWQSIGQPAVENLPIPSNISYIKAKPTEPEPKRGKFFKPKFDENDFPGLSGSDAPTLTGPSQWIKSSSNLPISKDNTDCNDNSKDGCADFSNTDRFSPVNIPSSPKIDKKMKPNKKKKKDSANPKERVKKQNAKNTMKGNSSLDDIASLLMNTVPQTVEDKTKKSDNKPVKSDPEVCTLEDQLTEMQENNIEGEMKSLQISDVSEEPIGKHNPVKFVIADDEFPSLNGPAKTGKKPPPGFKSEAQKTTCTSPPGFTQQMSSKVPPGFVSQLEPAEGSSKPVLGDKLIPNLNKQTGYEYSQPNEFQQRNKELIGEIQIYCTDPRDFLEFKRLSGEFRRSEIGAQQYYGQCEELLGKENFGQVFPELLVLLPDIAKQQELLSVYMMKHVMKKDDDVLNISGKQRSGKGAWKSSQSGFLTCQTCRQVLVCQDYNSHVSMHNLDSDFPSLPAESTMDKNKLGSYGSWVKAK